MSMCVGIYNTWYTYIVIYIMSIAVFGNTSNATITYVAVWESKAHVFADEQWFWKLAKDSIKWKSDIEDKKRVKFS